MTASVLAVSTSEKAGTKKTPRETILLKENYGIDGDAHASAKWHRQVSLLGVESIRKMEALGIKAHYGDFAENITTEGIELFSLPVGTRLNIGDNVILEISQIGKKCHHGCEIYKQVGQCVMPYEGVFAKVVRGGIIKAGDAVKIK